MGEEESKDNLIAFLNAVLNPDDQKKLVSLELLDSNQELIKEMITDKTGRLDVRAKTADGMRVDIEVQLTNQYIWINAPCFTGENYFWKESNRGMTILNCPR